MKLNFKYDQEKDVENFIKSAKSVNSKKPTGVMQKYIDIYGESFETEKLNEFITEMLNGVDVNQIISDITAKWSAMEDEFIMRSEKIFGCKYQVEEVTVFLTTNSRCTYNTLEKYFFVSIPRADVAHVTIMHELLHFYTKEAFEDFIPKEKYNDIKEALTVLLNVEYADLMGDKKDEGYPQHTQMRQKIIDLWLEGKNMKEIVAILAG